MKEKQEVRAGLGDGDRAILISRKIDGGELVSRDEVLFLVGEVRRWAREEMDLGTLSF